MKSVTGFILAAAVAALLVAGPAEAGKKKKAAQPPPAAALAGLASGQCDGSGPAEKGLGPWPGLGGGETMLLQHFDEIDTSQDGLLSKEEIEAWAAQVREQMQARRQERFAAADVDGDGALSREEARVGAPHLYEHFDFLDLDGNGLLTLAELEQLGDRELLRQRILERIQLADQDGNGKLDLAEVQVAFPQLATRFAQLDRDGDGYLSVEELQRNGRRF